MRSANNEVLCMKSINEDIKNNSFKQVYLLYGEEAYLKRMYKEKLRNASPNLTNVAWDAEDYNIYVDLQVVCPNRDDCGQETVGLGNNNYISLLEGVKLNSYSEVGDLTTSFTDICEIESHVACVTT